MIEVVLLARAEADAQRIFNRLEAAADGLGDSFLSRLREGLEQLPAFPESAPVYYAGYRRLLLHRLPYGLFFRVEGRRVIVVTVSSLLRDPRIIRAVLEDPES